MGWSHPGEGSARRYSTPRHSQPGAEFAWRTRATAVHPTRPGIPGGQQTAARILGKVKWPARAVSRFGTFRNRRKRGDDSFARWRARSRCQWAKVRIRSPCRGTSPAGTRPQPWPRTSLSLLRRHRHTGPHPHPYAPTCRRRRDEHLVQHTVLTDPVLTACVRLEWLPRPCASVVLRHGQ